MNIAYKELYKKFKVIQEHGWFEATSIYSREYGLKFEELLGINENEFFIPDYNGIEIKCHRSKSISKIHLFTCTPDGSSFFEI